MKRLIMTAALAYACIAGAALQVQPTTQYAIYALENRSSSNSLFKGITLKALHKTVFKQGITIPFCSWLTFRKEIVQEDPYIPSNALMLEVDGIVYGIWQDERDVWYARKFIPGICSREDCLPKALLSAAHKSVDDVEKAIKVLLVIERNYSLRAVSA